MKSLIYVIIILYVFNYVLSQTIDCFDIEPSQISDCTDHELNEDELLMYSGMNDASCCYNSITEKISGDQYNECSIERKNEVNQDYYINEKKDKQEFSNLTIICKNNSGYISYSIWLSLSLTFLFFGLF